jgi:RNA polymerase sigma-70 factor (ECF subfamily)
LLLFAETRERLARLTDETRLALALVVLEGLSYDEAAQRLNISQALLLKRLAQAREALRAMIASDERQQAQAAE